MSKTILLFLLSIILWSCTNSAKQDSQDVTAEIETIKKTYAPDKRVAWFQINAEKSGNQYVLTGESNLPEVVEKLKSRLEEKEISYIDSITLLPHNNLDNLTQGIITISVANLRSKPKHSAELSTQATLGTPVTILKKEGEWYWIQTPDGYLAWVDHGGLQPMNSNVFANWENAEKIIYKNAYGHSYNSENTDLIVSDLVAGAILRLIKETPNYFNVAYPDGRSAFIRKTEAEHFDLWLNNLKPNEDQLVSTAQHLMGLPYLWGGTSTKGVDCSGFTKTIYFLNGIILPRDASQQVHSGVEVDTTQKFENLRKGDLLFFGRKATDSTKERVVHVGMWIGNNEFIHSSSQVKIGSMDPEADNYDPANKARYLRTNRYLNQPSSGIINLKATPVFKN